MSKNTRASRKTGRTEQFATRVTIEWKEKIRKMAEEDGLMLVEILEESLKLYEKKRKIKYREQREYK